MTDNLLKVWIVDDDSDFCEYLQKMLENQSQYLVIGISNSLNQAYDDISHAMPELVTVDLSLPDGSGVELVKWLEKRMPDVKKIIISFWGQEEMVYEAITNGANGYLQKDHLLTMEMSKAIDTLESGGTPISPKLAKYFLKHFKDKRVRNTLSENYHAHTDTNDNSTASADPMNISDREIEVLELLTQGLSYNEIATELSVSYHTVSTHIKKIYKKLNVSSKIEAIAAAKDLF